MIEALFVFVRKSMILHEIVRLLQRNQRLELFGQKILDVH